MAPTIAFLDLTGACLFTVSAALLVTTASIGARRFGTSPSEQFWIAVAGAYLQIAGIATLLSPARGLTRDVFLGAQVVLVLIAWRLAKKPAGTLPTWAMTRHRLPLSRRCRAIVGLPRARRYSGC